MTESDSEVFAPHVYQAEGMLSARLGVPIEEAAMVLRIRAEGIGLSLEDAADDVIHARGSGSDPNIAGSC